MEMTAGQIMEAEISASTLGLHEDDDAVQPQEPATSSSSLRLPQAGGHHPDQDQDLPEDLFTSDVNQRSPSPASAAAPSSVPQQVLHKPPVITEETEVDTDEVEDEASNNTTNSSTPSSTSLVLKTTTTTGRKRPVAPSSVDIDSSPTPGKRGIVTTPMRTRHRNVSTSNMKNSKSGIGITESSRSSSIITSKKT